MSQLDVLKQQAFPAKFSGKSEDLLEFEKSVRIYLNIEGWGSVLGFDKGVPTDVMRRSVRSLLEIRIPNFDIYWTSDNISEEAGWESFLMANQSAQAMRTYLALRDLLNIEQGTKTVAEYIEAKQKAAASLKKIVGGPNISIDILAVLSAVMNAKEELNAGTALEALEAPNMSQFQAILTGRELLKGLQEENKESSIVAAKAVQGKSKLYTQEEEKVALKSYAPRSEEEKTWMREGICINFMKNKCRFGEKCKYKHPSANMAIVLDSGIEINSNLFSGKSLVLSDGHEGYAFAIDSACNATQAKSENVLSNVQPISSRVIIKTVGGQVIAEKKGTLTVEGGNGSSLTFPDVLVVPGGENLLAVNQMVDAGWEVSFKKGGCDLKHPESGQALKVHRSPNGLHYISAGVKNLA